MKPPVISEPLDGVMPSGFAVKSMDGDGDQLAVEHDREVLVGAVLGDAGQLALLAAFGDFPVTRWKRLPPLRAEAEADDRLAAAAVVGPAAGW